MIARAGPTDRPRARAGAGASRAHRRGVLAGRMEQTVAVAVPVRCTVRPYPGHQLVTVRVGLGLGLGLQRRQSWPLASLSEPQAPEPGGVGPSDAIMIASASEPRTSRVRLTE